MKKKKVYILFMSHKSGEHGLTVHDTEKSLMDELNSVVDVINDEADDEGREANSEAIEGCATDGHWAELSDGTWFDVFEREV